jgi:peptidoglycan/xylan/chitin deacetylase (PgdA/CDA1 family)
MEQVSAMDSAAEIATPVTRLADLGAPVGRSFALTFDDGPEEPWTSAVLDCLESLGVPATFFVLGSKIQGNERALRRMADLGCGVEVHSWEHIRMTEQQPARVADDIRRTSELIREVTGRSPRFVRPPDGAVSLEVLDQIRSTGMAPAFWSTQAWDWEQPGAGKIVRDVSKALRNGAVVLLHDGGGDRSQTVEAIPGIVRVAADRGLRAVRLGD